MMLINEEQLNNDGIGYIKQYDFSRANLNQESRIEAITTVASVCYANPKSIGSVKLYDRLATENKGLPSSSYEFVPVLIKNCNDDEPNSIQEVYNVACGEYIYDYADLSVIKYGEKVEGGEYYLTNLRALIADVGSRADEFFNTEEECTIIARHFKVFQTKIDLSTRAQYIRHRVSWQELSRRYVSGKKQEFEFYTSPKISCFIDEEQNEDVMGTLTKSSVELYNNLVANGVKPEEARRVLPQAMYTTVWSAWQPRQLDVFFKLRLDSHAQKEIRDLAEAKQRLLNYE